MKRIELLAPCKDLNKGKIAVMYGADAVYLGGKKYSLRSRASNFELEDIKEMVEFAHAHEAKVYVTVNMVMHQEDLEGLDEYLLTLDNMGVDAIITESLYAVSFVNAHNLKMEAHISTQANTCNSLASKLYQAIGAKRVVLSRECSIDDIEKIAAEVEVPLEVFIHGGMCSNYSGRCILSNRMTLRDANRGGCAQSCRWKYEILNEKGDVVSDPETLFSMSSKDLRATEYIERMIKCGVASLKIEGRMKSDYYIAQVVRTYKAMINEIYALGHLDEERIAYYNQELDKAENRPCADGLLSGTCGPENHLYGVNGAGVTHDYVAFVKSYAEGYAKVEIRNKFNKGDRLEVFGPEMENKQFIANDIFDEDLNTVEVVNQPMSTMYIACPYKLKKYCMIRKVS